MYNDQKHPENAAKLAQDHPDYSPSSHLFRMHGTSMATGLTSGIVALMLQAHPELTPNQVKYRLMYTAQQALTDDNEPLYNIFQQGMGRVWAPAAVLSEEIPTDGVAILVWTSKAIWHTTAVQAGLTWIVMAWLKKARLTRQN